MPTRRRDVVFTGQYNEAIHLAHEYEQWVHSPRPGGKLKLQSNLFVRSKLYVDRYSPANAGGAYYLTKDAQGPLTFLSDKETGIPELEAQSYAKFRGKLYKGSAALGVTFASYKQTREMVVSRYAQLTERADLVLAKFIRRPPTRKSIAGFHLEVIFGWVPLLADIIAGATTLCQQADRLAWVRASARSDSRFTRSKQGGYIRQDISVHSRVTRASQVRIANYNLWLAERAGLLNPAAVAWDLVPWSFVVNMFVNTGQLVNSITDFAGLDFPNSSTTTACVYTCAEVGIQTTKPPVYLGTSEFSGKYKYTSRGATTRPPLVVKMPGVNWELAAMAASLFTQKFSKLNITAQPQPRRRRTMKLTEHDWRNLSD